MEWLDYSLSIQGWMSRLELLWLYEKASQASVIVECGTWKGRSTSALAAGTPGVVYAVDRWQGTGPYEELNDPKGKENVKGQAIANLARFDDKVRIIDSKSDKALPLILQHEPNLKIDMLFLDSDHDWETVAMELHVYLPYVHGIACGHDYAKGVAQAVNERFGSVQRGPGSIWWVQYG